jgi:HSP20 family molecular chaperone IbpA
MTTLMEPVAPWLRDLNRLFTSEGNQFLPPADVLVTDDGVSVYMDVPGLKAEDLHRIQVKEEAGDARQIEGATA